MVKLPNLVGYRIPFLWLAAVYHIGVLPADKGPVGGDLHYIQFVDGMEFLGFGSGSTGHTRQFVIHPEQVLKGNSGQGLIFLFDSYVFFGLQRLVKPIRIPPSRHHSTGKLIHDQYLAVFHQIIHIPGKYQMGLEGLVNLVKDFHIPEIV